MTRVPDDDPDRGFERTAIEGALRTRKARDAEDRGVTYSRDAPAHALARGVVHRVDHETRIARAIQSPHLCAITDVRIDSAGVRVVARGGSEHTLDAVDGVALDVDTAIEIARAALLALAALHDAGLVHRDVRPSSVIVSPIPQLLFFGVSPHDLDPFPLFDPDLLDALGCVSPEQAGLLQGRVDARSDLYALGCVLHRALSGQPPFAAPDPRALLRQHVVAAPLPLPESTPAAMAALVMRLLARDPRERYQTASGALADLERIREARARGEADPFFPLGLSDRRSMLTEPAFVGRAEALDALARACERAPAVSLVEAPSGGGKSRLLQELVARFRQRGDLVVFGRGARTEAIEPFALIGQLLRDLRAQGDVEIARRVDGVMQSVPALSYASARARPEAGAGGARETAHAVRTLFEEAAALRPVLLVVDDAQWADASLVFLMEALSRTSARLTAVVAFRSEEVEATSPLRQLPVALSLRLPPLSIDALWEMLQSMAGRLPTEVRPLLEQVDGMPFAAVELLRGLVTSGALIDEGEGWTVGRGIDLSVSSQAAEQLVTRLARLAPTRLSALEALAVMGRSSSLDDALRVWSGDPVDLLAAFEDARRQQLVWTEAHGTRYTFAHDRIREAVLGQIETARLRALHLQAAASYEGEGGRAVYALAHHLHEGDAPERAFPYALAAARDAHARHALDLSEGFYRRAMRGCPNRAAELEVVEGLAEVLLRRGRYDESVRLWRRIREAATDALTRARAFGRIGEIGMKTGSREAYDDLAEALRLLGHPVPQGSVATGVAIVSQIAVQCLHSMAPSRFLARRSLRDAEGDLLASVIFDRMKQLTGLESRFPLTFWSHLRSLNTIERYPPTRQLGWVWIEHGEVLTLIAWFSRARRYLERGLALPETRSDPLQLARGLSRKGFLHYRSGALRSASELFTDALERLMRHSEEFWEIEILRFYLARVEFFRGRVSSATRLAREVHEKLRDGGDPCVGYAALADVVRNTGGRVPREALGEISLDLPPLANAEIHLGHGLWHLGRGEAALAAQRFRLSRFTTGGLEPTSHYVTRSCWEATAWRFAASTLAVGAGALRATYIRRARAAARRARAASTRSPVHLAHALLESAVLEAESGREVSARRLFRDALKTAVEQENHYYFAFALYEMGRVGAALGWSDASENLRDGAWAFRAIGLDPAPLEHFRLPAPQEVEAPPRLGLVDRFIGVIEAGRSIVSCLTEEAVLEAVRVAVIELLRPQRCLVWRERPPRGSSRSSLLVPLLVRGTPRVWMEAVHDDLDGFFRDDERMLAAHLAAIGGAALENADRFEAVRGLTRTLEAQGVELRASLEEKEAMLREIHHRVKNNLQIVVSLLSLQASHVDDPRVANAFGEVANRIHSMALIHEFVSGGDDMSEVPMDRYLRTLVDHVVFSQGSGGVRAIFGLEEITLPMSVAVDCGLVVNELVSNALEHGFPEGRKGMVKVSLYRADRGLCLEVADDGVGIDATRTPSLGLTLVGVLSRKLGTMRVESSASGTRTRIDFHG